MYDALAWWKSDPEDLVEALSLHGDVFLSSAGCQGGEQVGQQLGHCIYLHPMSSRLQAGTIAHHVRSNFQVKADVMDWVRLHFMGMGKASAVRVIFAGASGV